MPPPDPLVAATLPLVHERGLIMCGMPHPEARAPPQPDAGDSLLWVGDGWMPVCDACRDAAMEVTCAS